MKAAIVFTGSGPILVLTTYSSLNDPKFIEKMASKGIDKFIAYEANIEMVRQRYGQHFDATLKDVKQSDDLRVLDYNGYNVLHNFSFKNEVQPPVVHE